MRFKLLLLDANIIVELFKQGIWSEVISRCDVHVSETVVGESRFYDNHNEETVEINLQPDRDDERITVHDVSTSSLIRLRSRLGKAMLEKMDAGEAELLCVLDDAPLGEDYIICSADAIVYRYLGASQRSSQGVSLEVILKQIGLGRALDFRFTRVFQEQYCQKGYEEGFTGQAFRM